MKNHIDELTAIIEKSMQEWTAASKSGWYNKPKPDKWSKAKSLGI